MSKPTRYTPAMDSSEVFQGMVPDAEGEYVEYDNTSRLHEQYIYIIEEEGDDYHGSRLISAHADEEEANLQAAHLERTQVKSCGSDECTHRYSYHVTRVLYTTRCGHVMTGASTSVTHASPR